LGSRAPALASVGLLLRGRNLVVVRLVQNLVTFLDLEGHATQG